jgi:hypothetical protein
MLPRTLRRINYVARNPKTTYHPCATPNIDKTPLAGPLYIIKKDLKKGGGAAWWDPLWRGRVMTNSALIEQGVDLKNWGSRSTFGLFSGLVGIFFIAFFI